MSAKKMKVCFVRWSGSAFVPSCLKRVFKARLLDICTVVIELPLTHKYTQLPQKSKISSPKKLIHKIIAINLFWKICVVRISNMLRNSIYAHFFWHALRILNIPAKTGRFISWFFPCLSQTYMKLVIHNKHKGCIKNFTGVPLGQKQ